MKKCLLIILALGFGLTAHAGEELSSADDHLEEIVVTSAPLPDELQAPKCSEEFFADSSKALAEEIAKDIEREVIFALWRAYKTTPSTSGISPDEFFQYVYMQTSVAAPMTSYGSNDRLKTYTYIIKVSEVEVTLGKSRFFDVSRMRPGDEEFRDDYSFSITVESHETVLTDRIGDVSGTQCSAKVVGPNEGLIGIGVFRSGLVTKVGVVALPTNGVNEMILRRGK